MKATSGGEAHAARAELQAWYTRGLLPKLAQAAKSGTVDRGAVEALDDEVRSLLDLSHPREEAA
jgi:hypothetical protein